MSATATPPKPRERKSKIERVILPALLAAGSEGLTIREMIDPKTGKQVEALYIYQAFGFDKDGQPLTDPQGNPIKPLIEPLPEPVRTGKRGRPARRWKLNKATRDRLNRQRKRTTA